MLVKLNEEDCNIFLDYLTGSSETRISEIKRAASISYGSWDSDARNAYQSAIANIERELTSITNEVNSLKMYVYKEEK